MKIAPLILGLAVTLSGCTLRPLYAGGGSGHVARSLQSVQVAPIRLNVPVVRAATAGVPARVAPNARAAGVSGMVCSAAGAAGGGGAASAAAGVPARMRARLVMTRPLVGTRCTRRPPAVVR